MLSGMISPSSTVQVSKPEISSLFVQFMASEHGIQALDGR